MHLFGSICGPVAGFCGNYKFPTFIVSEIRNIGRNLVSISCLGKRVSFLFIAYIFVSCCAHFVPANILHGFRKRVFALHLRAVSFNTSQR